MSATQLPRHLRLAPLGPDADADADYLRARYGASGPSPLLLAALALLAASFVGWVVWAGLGQADRDVRWATTGFSGMTGTSVTVEFDVFKPADAKVVCLVRALDAKGVEVGRANVPVASPEPEVHVNYALPVTARASTALVDLCRIAD